MQSIFDVSGHGEIDGSFIIVPFECNAAVQFPLTILRMLVICAEDGDDMVGVLFSSVFDSEIFHHQTECDGAVIVVQ